MQPAPYGNILNNQGHSLTHERRSHLLQMLNELEDEQLRSFLENHLKNPLVSNNIANCTHAQLLRQCSNLIDTCYSYELEQTLQNVLQRPYSSNNYQQHNYSFPPKQQQQQQSVSSHQCNQQSVPSNNPPDSRSSITSIPVQQIRIVQPNPNVSRFSSIDNPRGHQHSSKSSYNQKSVFHPHQTAQSIRACLWPSKTPLTSLTQQHQTLPLSSQSLAQAPPPPSSHSSETSNSFQSVRTSKILHRNLPFYRLIKLVYERFDIFNSDSHLKQFVAHEEFTLPFDICNQLALSYDYDPSRDVHVTRKCLLLRLVRIDQPPTFHGKYEDDLPPNLFIHANGRPVSTLPAYKSSTRLPHDLIRAGREIDITSYCMFNPVLKNRITILWSYHPDNKHLAQQCANARYAVHIFLVEHLTVDDLCEHVLRKPFRFFRADLFRILARARTTDHELGLEVNDHQLKLICPIDQRRLKIPVRATTCQHLQCYDLINYLVLNEKSNQWICPVCNKPALYEDLQIDSYIDSILKSVENKSVTEVTLNNELHWSPVVSANENNVSTDPKSNTKSLPSSIDLILIDDE